MDYSKLARETDWKHEPKHKPSGLIIGACIRCLMDEPSSLSCPVKIAQALERAALEGRAEGLEEASQIFVEDPSWEMQQRAKALRARLAELRSSQAAKESK